MKAKLWTSGKENNIMNRQIIFRYYILLTMFVIGAVVSVIWAIRYTKNPSQRSPYSALIWVAVIEKTLIYGSGCHSAASLSSAS